MQKKKEKSEKDFLSTIGLPYFGKISHQFSKRLKVLIRNTFKVNFNVYYKPWKLARTFKWNVLLLCIRFQMLCINLFVRAIWMLPYVGITTLHLGVRVEEHLYSKKNPAVQKHINVCHPIRATNIFLTISLFLKHTIFNTTQKFKKRC